MARDLESPQPNSSGVEINLNTDSVIAETLKLCQLPSVTSAEHVGRIVGMLRSQSGMLESTLEGRTFMDSVYDAVLEQIKVTESPDRTYLDQLKNEVTELRSASPRNQA